MIVGEFGGELIVDGAWRDRDFAGLRVGVIAPGAEAARIVPRVLRSAAVVKVFQEAPALGYLQRVRLRLSVPDPWMRRQLTPDRFYGSRRATISGDYYRALKAPNCTLVTWPVYAIVPGGVRTAEGIEHGCDCVVVGETSAFALAPAHREERSA